VEVKHRIAQQQRKSLELL